MKKRFVACTLTFLLILTVFLPVGAIPDENWDKKITPELWKMLDRSDGKDIITVYLWTKDVDYAQIEEAVYNDTGFNMENIGQEYEPINKKALKADEGSSELQKLVLEHKELTKAAREKEQLAADTYIDATRRLSKTAHNKLNSENINNLGIDEKAVVYSSKYAPMVIADMTADQIRAAAGNRTVTFIDLVVDMISEDESMESAVKTVRAHTVRDTLGYDGTGVKIGQIESYMPENEGILTGVYTYLTGGFEILKNYHAFYVASTMYTIAPGADYYANSINVDNMPRFYARIEELIDAGCNIINMSKGFYQNLDQSRTNWYTNEERWIDHIEGPHGISFVTSAGNKGETHGHISSPGMAYNAITVGAIHDGGTWNDQSDDSVCPASNYANNGSTDCAKPDFMAPDTAIDILPDGGTSIAAPVVSGVIAQLMEFKPMLKTRARLVKAVLTASCRYKVSEPLYTGYTGLTAVEGAGVIDAHRAYLILANNTYLSGSFTTDEISFNINLSGLTSRVAFAWCRISGVGNGHTNPVSHTGDYINLDMYLYNPNGSLLAQSTLLTSSVEQIYTSSTWDTYRLVIKRKTSPGVTAWYGLAWL